MISGCYDNLSEERHNEIKELKEVKVASIQQQMDSIKRSLSNIEALTKELDGYMEVLAKVSAGLAEDYEKLNAALEEAKSEIQGNIDAAAADMLKEYEGAKSTLEGKIGEINNILDALKERKTQLNERADALKTSLENDYATKDWVTATFATLESQKAVGEDVQTLKSYIEELEKSLDATKNSLLSLLENNMSEIRSIADERLRTAFEKLNEDYGKAITAATEEVQKAFSDSLAKAISNSTESLKGWVGEKLDGYITIAAAKGHINAIYALIGTNPEDPVDESYKSIQTKIEELQVALAKAEKDLETAYTKAIEDAITQSGKDMDAEIARQIAEVTDEVGKVELKVKDLEDEVIKLCSKVAELQNRIKTVGEQADAIKASLHILDSLNMTLEQYIGGVKSALLDNDEAKYNETKALIDALQAASDAIKEKIDSLSGVVGTLPEGATDLTTWVAATMGTIDAQFDLYCLTDTVNAYKGRVDALLGTQAGLISDYQTQLDGLIDKVQSAFEGWINDSLKVFHTKDEIGSLLNDRKTKLANSIAGQDSTINAHFDTLLRAYNKAVSDFIKEYKDAVAKAIIDNQGNVDAKFEDAIAKANAKINALNDRITKMDKAIEDLEEKIEIIRNAVNALGADIKNIASFIDTTGFKSLQAFVDYVNSELAKCPTTFARIGQVDTLRMTIYGEPGKDSTGLKFWVDQMGELTERLGAAETMSDSLKNFLSGFDAGKTLNGELSAIYGLLKELKEEVDGDGTDGKKGLQTILDSIWEALGVIGSRLTVLEQNVIAVTFHSISYIPKTADASVNAGNVTLEFIIDPAGLVPLLNEGNCRLTNGNITNVTGSNGVLTVTASDVVAGWTALCVEGIDNNVEGAEDRKLEFISQYIRVK